jgi:malonate transporter
VNGVLNGFAVIGIVIVLGYLLARSGVLGPAAVRVLSLWRSSSRAPRCCS